MVILVALFCLFFAFFLRPINWMTVNTYTISQKNHSAMIFERSNEYLDKGIKMFANKCGTPAVSRESILILVYAWNLGLIPLTDITRPMVVTGRFFFSSPLTFQLEKTCG